MNGATKGSMYSENIKALVTVKVYALPCLENSSRPHIWPFN